MADLYASYTALAAAEIEGVDYERRTVTVSGATWCAIAIHGGGIEGGSGEAARAVAAGLMNHYEFAGIQAANNFEDLHVTSTNFDEPIAQAQVAAARRCLSFHGYVGDGVTPETSIGGLDTVLVARVTAALTAAGFRVVTAASEIAGTNPSNICNLTSTSAGVQLEMSRALRESFFPGNTTSRAVRDSGQRTEVFNRYVAAVRSAYIGYGRMSMGAVNSSRWTLLPISVADVTVSATVATDVLAAGGSHFLAVAARVADVNNCYLARLELSTSQAVILTLRKRVASTESLIVQYTTGLTHAAGVRCGVDLQVAGSTLRARAWSPAPGGAKPDWQLETTDTSLTAAGQVGLRSILSTTNTNTLPVVATWGDVAVDLGYQTATVVRAVNGVSKAQTAGTAVHLADAKRWGL